MQRDRVLPPVDLPAPLQVHAVVGARRAGGLEGRGEHELGRPTLGELDRAVGADEPECAAQSRGPVSQELVDLGSGHGDADVVDEHPPLVLGHRDRRRRERDVELGALAEDVHTVVADRAGCAVGRRSAVEHRARAEHQAVLGPDGVEEHLGLLAEDRTALALPGHERDPERRRLAEQRPQERALEVVEVHPVALARQPGELAGAVERRELQEPRVLLRREPEPVDRVGERAPGELPAHPVAGVAPRDGADTEPDAAGPGRQRSTDGACPGGELRRHRVPQLELQPHRGALRAGHLRVVAGEAGEVVPPVRLRWGLDR